MSRLQIFLFTALSMLAFAGNSLLCRLALRQTGIDAASFSSIRVCSGALVLWLILRARSERIADAGNWYSGFALFAYVAAFSFAYVSLPVASGALLLFGAVQATMIGYGLRHGEKLSGRQIIGLMIALLGLVGLLLPGLAPPPLNGALLMAAAGIAWGVYSLRAKGAANPVRITAGNFARAVPFIVALNLLMLPSAALDGAGILYGLASGALASGVTRQTTLPTSSATSSASDPPSPILKKWEYG